MDQKFGISDQFHYNPELLLGLGCKIWEIMKILEKVLFSKIRFFAKITEKLILDQKTFAISKDFRNFLWNRLLLIKSNQFGVILKVISSEYQYMSTNGRNGPFTKMAYLGRKLFIFSNSLFRIGFLVSFYLSPELDLLKCAQCKKIWGKFKTLLNPDQCPKVDSMFFITKIEKILFYHILETLKNFFLFLQS